MSYKIDDSPVHYLADSFTHVSILEVILIVNFAILLHFELEVLQSLTHFYLGQVKSGSNRGDWKSKGKGSWADNKVSNSWDTSGNQDAGWGGTTNNNEWGNTAKSNDGWGNTAKSKDGWGNTSKGNDGWGNAAKSNDGSNTATNDWGTSNDGGDWGNSQENSNEEKRRPHFKKKFNKDKVDFNTPESKFFVFIVLTLHIDYNARITESYKDGPIERKSLLKALE